MHSYTTTNRDLRSAYLKDLSKGKIPKGPYPANVNLKNFNYFLWAPTLCYEVEYPRSGPFRLWYAVNKAIKGLACLVYNIMEDKIRNVLHFRFLNTSLQANSWCLIS